MGTSQLFQILLLLASLSIESATAQEMWVSADNPIELGQVHWLRNYDEAVTRSVEKDLPILILFQEVPGCANCTNYGKHVLSHPFMVEMIETHFVPLAIYNNVGGHDREILRKFKEPTWNNPVVRIINNKGNDLVTRLSGDFSERGLATKIKAGLSLSGQVEPRYFTLYQQEVNGAEHSEEAYLSMYCFWTGEKEIAQIPGVLSTEAGFMHGKEVVKVIYDKSGADLKAIVKVAKEQRCADQVFADEDTKEKVVDRSIGTYRIDREVKYYLRHTDYRSIPMTALQAAKVNAAIGEGQRPEMYLSPRQLALYERSTKSEKNYINQDFMVTWYEAISQIQ